MSSPRVRRSIAPASAAALLAAAALTGCFGNRYAAENSSTVQLQGVWRLNRAASEDPQKIIDKLKEEAEKKIRRALNAQQAGSVGGPGGGGPGGGGGRRRGQGGGGQQSPSDPLPEDLPQAPGPGVDPLRNSPTMHELRAILQRSDFLTIRQSTEQVSFDYGTTVRSYSPGGRSVVSSENGVADQSSGWSGKQYVINIKPQLGPLVLEEYSLSPDGKQLIVKSHIGPFELSKVNLTRVYDATGTVIPTSAPSND
jgi:hypothetical protein